eukprot:g12157.t1
MSKPSPRAGETLLPPESRSRSPAPAVPIRGGPGPLLAPKSSTASTADKHKDKDKEKDAPQIQMGVRSAPNSPREEEAGRMHRRAHQPRAAMVRALETMATGPGSRRAPFVLKDGLHQQQGARVSGAAEEDINASPCYVQCERPECQKWRRVNELTVHLFREESQRSFQCDYLVGTTCADPEDDDNTRPRGFDANSGAEINFTEEERALWRRSLLSDVPGSSEEEDEGVVLTGGGKRQKAVDAGATMTKRQRKVAERKGGDGNSSARGPTQQLPMSAGTSSRTRTRAVAVGGTIRPNKAPVDMNTAEGRQAVAQQLMMQSMMLAQPQAGPAAPPAVETAAVGEVATDKQDFEERIAEIYDHLTSQGKDAVLHMRFTNMGRGKIRIQEIAR